METPRMTQPLSCRRTGRRHPWDTGALPTRNQTTALPWRPAGSSWSADRRSSNGWERTNAQTHKTCSSGSEWKLSSYVYCVVNMISRCCRLQLMTTESRRPNSGTSQSGLYLFRRWVSFALRPRISCAEMVPERSICYSCRTDGISADHRSNLFNTNIYSEITKLESFNLNYFQRWSNILFFNNIWINLLISGTASVLVSLCLSHQEASLGH